MSKELLSLFIVLLIILILTKTYLNLVALNICLYLALYYFLKIGAVVLAQAYVRKSLKESSKDNKYTTDINLRG